MVCSSSIESWGETHLIQPHLQFRQLALLHHQCLIIQILDNVLMAVLIDLHDYGFDGGVTFHEDAWDWVPRGISRALWD